MDQTGVRLPAALEEIERETAAIGLAMASDRQTGALLRVLAASKPRSFLLELGTGTGLSTAWILDGMSRCSTLLSVDHDWRVMDVARRHLRGDSRVTFFCEGMVEFLASLRGRKFDLIFANPWPGQFRFLDETLALLDPGGMYIASHLLPQPGWPEEQRAEVEHCLGHLEARSDLAVVRLCWSTGVAIATKLAVT